MERKITYFSWFLIGLSTVLQCIMLGSNFNRLSQPVAVGAVEMLLILALLANSLLIFRHVTYVTQNRRVRLIAQLCLVSLALCVGGDWINRNFPQVFYRYDDVIKHSYLADSVWCFFPGYGLFLLAVFFSVVKRTGLLFISMTCLCAMLLGLLSFIAMQIPGTHFYILMMTGSYAVLISLMIAAGLLLLKAYSWKSMHWMVIGAFLAVAADAIIGNFWLYREGFYPQVAHINWIVYFTSQALIQKLPLAVLAAR